MAWQTVGGGQVQSGASPGFAGGGMYQNSETGNFVFVLTFAQLQSLASDVKAAAADMKTKRAVRTGLLDKHQDPVNARRHGLQALSRSGIAATPSTNVSLDETDMPKFSQSVLELFARVGAELSGAEERQDQLFTLLERFADILSSEKLWSLLGGGENGLLLMAIRPGGITGTSGTDLGPGV